MIKAGVFPIPSPRPQSCSEYIIQTKSFLKSVALGFCQFGQKKEQVPGYFAKPPEGFDFLTILGQLLSKAINADV